MHAGRKRAISLTIVGTMVVFTAVWIGWRLLGPRFSIVSSDDIMHIKGPSDIMRQASRRSGPVGSFPASAGRRVADLQAEQYFHEPELILVHELIRHLPEQKRLRAMTDEEGRDMHSPWSEPCAWLYVYKGGGGDRHDEWLGVAIDGRGVFGAGVGGCSERILAKWLPIESWSVDMEDLWEPVQPAGMGLNCHALFAKPIGSRTRAVWLQRDPSGRGDLCRYTDAITGEPDEVGRSVFETRTWMFDTISPILVLRGRKWNIRSEE